MVDRTNMNISGCDKCFQAKQCRSEFPLSEDKSKECFEMIHCDLWGPYRTQVFQEPIIFSRLWTIILELCRYTCFKTNHRL